MSQCSFCGGPLPCLTHNQGISAITNSSGLGFESLEQVMRERENYNGMHQAAVIEIERLKRRIRVLEKVISEELYHEDCMDDANQMIVDEIQERTLG